MGAAGTIVHVTHTLLTYSIEAAAYGNPVIITGYGGQLDYLKGVFYVSSSDEPPWLCSELQPGHETCRRANTCQVYRWYEGDQLWGKPMLEVISFLSPYALSFLNTLLEDAKRMMKWVHGNYAAAKLVAQTVTKPYLEVSITS